MNVLYERKVPPKIAGKLFATNHLRRKRRVLSGARGAITLAATGLQVPVFSKDRRFTSLQAESFACSADSNPVIVTRAVAGTHSRGFVSFGLASPGRLAKIQASFGWPEVYNQLPRSRGAILPPPPRVDCLLAAPMAAKQRIVRHMTGAPGMLPTAVPPLPQQRSLKLKLRTETAKGCYWHSA